MTPFKFNTTTRFIAVITFPLMIVLGTLSLASIASTVYGASIFFKPTGVAVDPGGFVFVVDGGNGRIQKFNPDGSFIRKWGSIGIGEGQFNNPSGIAIDSSGDVYIAEIGNNRIQKFSNTGDFKGQWGSYCRIANGENCTDPDGYNAPLAKGDGQFYNPAGITVDKSGSVYVADSGNHRIQKFSNTGKFLGKWGTFGRQDGQFRFPMDITIDSSGYAYVADRDNNRIQKFNHIPSPAGGAIIGIFESKWGTYGTGNYQFKGPVGIERDSSNNLYITDSGNSRIQKFSNAGTFITHWGYPGNSKNQFQFPWGISVDPSSTVVYVADSGNHRVQKSTPNGDFIMLWGPYPAASYGIQDDPIISANYRIQDGNYFNAD